MRFPFGNLGQQIRASQFVDARNIRGGIITAQQLVIAGGTQGVLRSENYSDADLTGWAIFGDGSAVFNTVTVRSDIESANWNGASPADLTTPDPNATQGFYLDSSIGVAQFNAIWLKLGLIVTGAHPTQQAIFGTITKSGADDIVIQAKGKLLLESIGDSGFGGFDRIISQNRHWFNDGLVNTPGIAFLNDTDTGIYRTAADANTIKFTTGGTLAAAIGTELTMSVPIQGSSAAASIYIGSNSTSLAVTTERVVLGQNFGLFVRASGAAVFAARNSDGESLGIYRSGSHIGGMGATSGTLALYDDANNRAVAILNGGSASSVYLRDGLTDVGNHETLRLDRGTGTTVRAVGYFSSWAESKTNILSLAKSPRFPGLQVIDEITPIDFKRKSTKQREWGFLLDQFKELDDRLKYLTTKGDSWGYSPDENAIAAVLWLGVQDLRQRMERLEARLDVLS
jgi:hypothetical protein